MISIELLDRARPTVELRRQVESSLGTWSYLQVRLARGIQGGDSQVIEVRSEVFLAELEGLREAKAIFGEAFSYGPRIREQLTRLANDRKLRESAVNGFEEPDLHHLADQLASAGFTRVLKEFQLENLAHLRSLPHGADFSVPGAGKTTVALANYALERQSGVVNKLLVIGPIASFDAWKTDSAACFAVSPKIEVHLGSGHNPRRDTEILLTNYNRLAADYEGIRGYVTDSQPHLILDEAHRIKKGSVGVHGRAVLDLAHLAIRRDVLTGTPAPQGAGDLIALMRFLYPGQDRSILPSTAYDPNLGRDPSVVRETSIAIEGLFVRTAKSRLGLPKPKWDVIRSPMLPIQSAIYDALVGRYRGDHLLSLTDRRGFDRLGRVTMYLLEAATNPRLLLAGSDRSDDEGFAHPPLEVRENETLHNLLSDYNKFERPWKYDEILRIVRDASERGEKVLVWTSFIRNIRALERELKEYQPAVVHGGIPPLDSAPNAAVTRDAELDRFRNDPDCSVLLANPAAAGEGISLHHWCHHAVYMDRTFNAGHFLQSQDRIHRLGLAEGTETVFTILISEGTIDEVVDGRLREKVVALGKLLDDPGLVSVALPEVDDEEPQRPADSTDSTAVLEHLHG